MGRREKGSGRIYKGEERDGERQRGPMEQNQASDHNLNIISKPHY